MNSIVKGCNVVGLYNDASHDIMIMMTGKIMSRMIEVFVERILVGEARTMLGVIFVEAGEGDNS